MMAWVILDLLRAEDLEAVVVGLVHSQEKDRQKEDSVQEQ